jgi:hypothetical protein
VALLARRDKPNRRICSGGKFLWNLRNIDEALRYAVFLADDETVELVR